MPAEPQSPKPEPALLPLSLAALACWLFALYFPIAQVTKLGLSQTFQLSEIGNGFRGDDQLLLGIATDLMVFLFPTALFLLLPVLTFTRFSEREYVLKFVAVKACVFVRQWAMPDVFALSILVAFAKIGSIANAAIGTGFYFLGAAVLLLSYILQRLRMPEDERMKSRSASSALLVAACILLVPANLLPIMELTTPRGSSQSTILNGIANLADHGLWGLAAIVFIASILVPFAKIGGLAWLLRHSKQKKRSPRAPAIHRLLGSIGRWSMLDIFLIGTLAGLIDFGSLSSVRPGPAAPAFAAAVVLTTLAVERFDVRSQLVRSHS